jgi:hypothetical protein
MTLKERKSAKRSKKESKNFLDNEKTR